MAVTREFGIPVIGEFRNDQACRKAERFRFAGSPVRRFADDPAVQDCVASPVQLVGTPHVVGFLGFRVDKTRAPSDELTIHNLGWITTWFVILNLCAGLLACC